MKDFGKIFVSPTVEKEVNKLCKNVISLEFNHACMQTKQKNYLKITTGKSTTTTFRTT